MNELKEQLDHIEKKCDYLKEKIEFLLESVRQIQRSVTTEQFRRDRPGYGSMPVSEEEARYSVNSMEPVPIRKEVEH